MWWKRLHAVRFLRVGEVVALVGRSEPHSRLLPGIEHDLLGETEAEIFLKELAVRLHVDGEAVEVVEPANAHPARGIALRLILERGAKLLGRLVPARLVVELHDVAVGIVETISRAMAEPSIDPVNPRARPLDCVHTALKRPGASSPESHMPKGRRAGGRQLKRKLLVVVPGAQINRVALPAALGHAHDIDEEAQTFLRFWRQELEVAEMRHIHDRLSVHGLSSCRNVRLFVGRVLRRDGRPIGRQNRISRVDGLMSYRFFGARYYPSL